MNNGEIFTVIEIGGMIMKRHKICHVILGFVLVCALLVNLTGCGTQVQAADLMEGIEAESVSGKMKDDTFIDSQMRLSLELFQSSVQASKNKNVLISPLSIQLALAMTANGAGGQTKTEMEKLLGGELTIEELNKYLYTYAGSLPSGDKYRITLANSIWFRDDEDRLTVEKEFLQTNANYYGAQAYKAPFDRQTLADINNWAEEHTDGMIDKILDTIDSDTVMYLINALVFDAEWNEVYEKSDIYNDIFTSVTGKKRTVEMMNSGESGYLDDGKAKGFIKDYKEGRYSFVALLPNEGVDIYEYIEGLTSEGLMNAIQGAQSDVVMATMPKFSYEYSLKMNDVLADLGMPSAFSSAADFSKLGKSAYGNLYIGEVLHKTFISVDELGTKAGAVTKVDVKDECAVEAPSLAVKLDRPFVYMIMDNSANLPVFIGAVMDIP